MPNLNNKKKEHTLFCAINPQLKEVGGVLAN